MVLFKNSEPTQAQWRNLLEEITKTFCRYLYLLLINSVFNLFYSQCAIPVFEGLLPAPHDTLVTELLFELCSWHSLAKLRLATEATVIGLEGSTRRLGRLYRRFLKTTCTIYETRELPAETAVRGRRIAALTRKKPGEEHIHALNSKKITLQLNTSKFHALGDYATYIRKYGTTDNYSTQLVCLWLSVFSM